MQYAHLVNQLNTCKSYPIYCVSTLTKRQKRHLIWTSQRPSANNRHIWQHQKLSRCYCKKRNYLGVAEGTKCMQGTSTSHQPIACNGCSENGAVMCRSRSITSPTFYSEMPSPQWINMARMTHLFCKCRAWEERCPCLQSRAIQCGHCALLRFKRTVTDN